MSNAREIRTKIKSVQNTKKVTRALEMVSASKIRKAQERMAASRPYADMMRQVAGHIAHATPEYRHPFMIGHEEIKRVGYIVVSSDRGLCGALNSTEFRTIVAAMQDCRERDVDVDVVTLGNKANQFFKRLPVNLIGHVGQLGDKPEIAQLIGVVKVMFDKFRNDELDRVYLCFNQFVNTMTQKPRIDQLLPLPAIEDSDMKANWDYIYEPEAAVVLDHVLTRYIESLVYHAVLENVASEHAARMIAMKAASDNATDFIDDLTLDYNKARQAAITQELSEIVSGAAAV